jgi:uncharacterized protein DUF6236
MVDGGDSPPDTYRLALRTAARFIEAISAIDLKGYRVATEAPVTSYDLRNALAAWKISSPLVELLAEAGSVRTVRDGRLAVDSRLAHAYLLTLGTEIAADLGASPLADDAFDHAAAGLSARRVAAGLGGTPLPLAAAEERVTALVNIALSVVVPRDFARCPVHKIIDFRRRYAGERARFNQAVSSLLADAPRLDTIHSESALLEHLRALYDTQIAPALDDIERAMRGLRIDTALGTVNTQTAVPTAAATSVALLALHPSASTAAAIGFGGLALGVWKAARDAGRSRTAALDASPVSYLFHLRHDLSPLSLAEQVRAVTARFTPPEA